MNLKLKELNAPFVVLCLFYLMFSGCNDEHGEEAAIEASYLFTLDQEENVFSDIHSFGVLDDSTFVVITAKPSSISLYHVSGKFLGTLPTNYGEGPLEIVHPQKLKVYDNTVFVWCDVQHKLVAYDRNGAIYEIEDISFAINDFALNDDYIAFYKAFTLGESYLEIYDRKQSKFVKDFGQAVNEEVLLALNADAGGMFFEHNDLYFNSGFQLILNEINIENGEIAAVSIVDNEFKISQPTNDAPSLINSDFSTAMNYGLTNSIVTGLYLLNNHKIIIAEIGELELNKGALSNINRKEKYYLFDLDNNFVKSLSGSYEYQRPLFSAYQNTLYRIKVEERESEFNFNMYEIILK